MLLKSSGEIVREKCLNFISTGYNIFYSRMNANRSSIRQVAALANVSPKTVTNVMREREIVAPATKARVVAAVRELD